ncbi:hypothetical protein D1007_50850 [Hordeum vulgare]|nr:hypothetical protein D1007_50850 [Hordeum vulgare]
MSVLSIASAFGPPRRAFLEWEATTTPSPPRNVNIAPLPRAPEIQTEKIGGDGAGRGGVRGERWGGNECGEAAGDDGGGEAPVASGKGDGKG